MTVSRPSFLSKGMIFANGGSVRSKKFFYQIPVVTAKRTYHSSTKFRIEYTVLYRHIVSILKCTT